jgi:hypothetical protein
MADDGFEDVAPRETDRARRRREFALLGYGVPIDEELRAAGTIGEAITERHRRLVRDLTAAGLPQASVARIIGMSLERLQSLFEYELGTAFEVAQASIARTVYLQAVDGDMNAASIWLRNHNRSDWSSKHMNRNIDEGKEDAGDAVEERVTNEAFMQGVIAGLQVDRSYKRPASIEKQAPRVLTAPAKESKIKSIVRKPKGD